MQLTEYQSQFFPPLLLTTRGKKLILPDTEFCLVFLIHNLQSVFDSMFV